MSANRNKSVKFGYAERVAMCELQVSGFQSLFASLNFWLAALILALPLSASMAAARAHPQPDHAAGAVTLEGQLTSSPGKATLKTRQKDYVLAATTTYVLHTLQDKRLQGREVRAEGRLKPDGTFEVEKFFTIHDSKLYRVRYYCETCNIVAVEPGRCVCCQKPTELQEMPVDGSDQDAITVP
jgi:hypothetical protein